MHAAGADKESMPTIEIIDGGRRMKFRTDEAATAFFYHDCPPEVARWACSRAAGSPAAAGHMAVRLGVEPFFLDTSHSPFLSQPAMCAELILEAIGRPPIGPLRPC
jgi:hypothetical protein